MYAESGDLAALGELSRQRHAGAPDYALAAQLVAELPVPVLISGGLRTAQQARDAFEQTGAEAVLLARGSLGNPWLFAELVGGREQQPTREEILTEIDWVLERAVEHMGEDRANRYLRKFYPWYIERLGGVRAEQAVLQAALQQAPSTAAARELFNGAILSPRSILSRPSRAVAVDSRASGLFSVPT